MVSNHLQVPGHVAIIMDGNGRWANGHNLPRAAGHNAGVKALRKIAEHCVDRKIDILTVYAFSSENWRRPEKEVSLLMELFMSSLKSEAQDLHKNNIVLRFIGERTVFPEKLQATIADAEALTADNTGLSLVIAANYGGRWDIVTACKKLAEKTKSAEIDVSNIDEALLNRTMCLGDLIAPDLFIRTGGEKRISNFLLWQLAYTELYFTDILWPDFGAEQLDEAVAWFSERQRRFGRTAEQVR
ncbi:MAG: di-trans,poly-cis-decaprenylcistransferase [Proteobacteria bacterium]|nr:di-trans,poly-cis-decaprenylcistransferase [Pseudomonadota bacterium]